MTALLDVRALSVSFGPGGARRTIVDRIDFSIGRGEIVALVGESGSGKSATALALSRLNEGPRCGYSGEIRLSGRNILALDHPDLRRLRGRAIATIFQDPLSALNPSETIAQQIAEGMRAHGMAGPDADDRITRLLGEVGIHDPDRVTRAYPHQISGGQRQRVMIALALACDPELLIADEPTTALDVTVQTQVLATLYRAVQKRGMSVLIITHDMGVVAGMADRVMVMYGGRIVESAPVETLFALPRHPYTRALLDCARHVRDASGHYATIPGTAETAFALRATQGCAFAPRCRRARPACFTHQPELAECSDTGRVACHFPLVGSKIDG
ncbi:ABC transporter ATP-binding protein [Gluconacetobacter sacchari]|uniref:ABC transporter ATP-binding protein n=2 Tax=Gluconacetobacter sacchari TaxID=92759 RepID=A0A7W4IFD5_9PROT|nr:ABC transporter ATP-binding protein [Gluconacetobacter sacchari]MBB2161764.1 ABC transporter ATP-binding protein [Gluconacetobacter sacchari]